METIEKEFNRVFLYRLPALQTLDMCGTISIFNLFPLISSLTSSHTNLRPSRHNPLSRTPTSFLPIQPLHEGIWNSLLIVMICMYLHCCRTLLGVPFGELLL